MIGTTDHWAIKCYYSQFCATSKEIRKRNFLGSHQCVVSTQSYWRFKMTIIWASPHQRGLFTNQGKLIPESPMTCPNKRNSMFGGGDIPHTCITKPRPSPLGQIPKVLSVTLFLHWMDSSFALQRQPFAEVLRNRYLKFGKVTENTYLSIYLSIYPSIHLSIHP